jgi:hypothetical protein
MFWLGFSGYDRSERRNPRDAAEVPIAGNRLARIGEALRDYGKRTPIEGNRDRAWTMERPERTNDPRGKHGDHADFPR